MSGLRVTGIGLWLAFACACTEDPAATEAVAAPAFCVAIEAAHVVDYELPPMPDDHLWYRGTVLQDLDAYPQDEAGVIMMQGDSAPFYNMIQIAWKGLAFAANFEMTGDSAYLDRAVVHGEHLLATADKIDGVLYFPYQFDFALHGRVDEVMEDPWYSGMGQGVGLSLLLRLGHLTNDPRYRAAADRVMRSFSHTAPDGSFVARVDCEGYYWIEEYPRHPSTGTLNGFLFGLLGVYEYWRETDDPAAYRLVRAGLATARHYFDEFRVPGEVSYYCLLHREQIPAYHLVHIELLLHLYRLSGDPFFWTTLEGFAADVDFDIPEWWKPS